MTYKQFIKSLPLFNKIYDHFKKRRYRYLYQIIKNNKCRRIMEIGVCDGEQARKMIKLAKKFHNNQVEYYGFDLFEEIDQLTYKKEAAKNPLTLQQVKTKLSKTGCQINLFKGPTQQTLPQVISQLPQMDLIFIDGGHSLKTIASDWKYSQLLMSDKTIVIFDDYWNRSDLGCRQLITGLDPDKFKIKILPIQDQFRKSWGVLRINFVQVERQ